MDLSFPQRNIFTQMVNALIRCLLNFSRFQGARGGHLLTKTQKLLEIKTYTEGTLLKFTDKKRLKERKQS